MVSCFECGREQGFFNPKKSNVPPTDMFKHKDKNYCGACLLIVTEERKE